MSRTNATIRFSSEWSLLARYNIGLAQDLGRSKLEAYIEDGSLGLAYRPVTHDWASVLFKIARRVEMRPLGVNAGLTENLRLHVATIEPIVELPYNLQLVSKLALKHSGLKLDDLDAANAFTTLSTLRLNWRAMRALNPLDLGFGVPGDIDFGWVPIRGLLVRV